MHKLEKRQFLAKVDLSQVNFEVKISDFGLSTIIEDSTAALSICGTPLYSSPQLLKKNEYTNKVDTWALGVMLYELLMGVTPFHSFEMKELMAKINDGRYSVVLNEPLTVECALFLTQCLQSSEKDRIGMEELAQHPFIDFDPTQEMRTLDARAFESETKHLFNSIPTNRQTAAEQYVKLPVSTRGTIPDPVFFSTKDTKQWTVLDTQLRSSNVGTKSVDIFAIANDTVIEGLGSAETSKHQS